MVWEFYDEPRTGVALHNDVAHYFRCKFDEQIDEYSSTFEICPVSNEFLEVAEEQWQIFRKWQDNFHHGLASVETHPGQGGKNARYDELDDWLCDAIGLLKPLPEKFVPRFKPLPNQDHLPVGVLRELEAAWISNRIRNVRPQWVGSQHKTIRGRTSAFMP